MAVKFFGARTLGTKNHPYPCLVRKKRAVEYMFVQYSMLTFCDIKLHIITANHVNKILGHLLVSRHLGKGLFKLLVDRLELLLLGHQLVLKAVHLFTVYSYGSKPQVHF